MAINLATQYPGRVTAADANYTYGSSKNETVPGAGDGTPYELARANDIFGFQQALLRAASIVPNGNAETQLVSEYMEAVIEIASGRAISYDESGIAGTYVADVRANQQGPRSYFNDLIVEFTPGNNNAGASTVNVNGLGVKNIFFNGVALVGGELLTTTKAFVRFDLGNDRFNLIQTPDASETLKGIIELATQVEVDAGVDAVRAVTPATLSNVPVAAASVDQASLKTATGEVSTAASAELTLAGGEYGFYPQVKYVGGSDDMAAQIAQVYSNAAYTTNILLGINTTGTAFARQRYIQASPPYDLGDGVIQMFVYVLLDKTTKQVISTYSAPDPVWANNGPTKISNSGPVVIAEKFSNDAQKMANYLKKLRGAKTSSVSKGKKAKFKKFTAAQKNTDMNLIPHPFPGYDAAQNIVVLLDPVSDFNADLFNIHNYSGDSIAELLHSGNIIIDNVPLSMTMPRDVVAVTGRFK